MFPYLEIFGVQIPTYFLWISLVLSTAIIWNYKRSFQFHLSRKIALDLSLVIMITGLMGGRLMHVLYEAPEVYAEYPIGALYIWKGGFVYFGGALLSFFCSWIFIRIKKEDFEIWLNFFAPMMSFSYGFGRIGCFLAGCCFGRYCEWPWAVANRHPTQIYSFLWELGLLLILLGREKTNGYRLGSSNQFLLWAAASSMGRLVMEFYRDDFRGPVYVLSISSWISLGILFICLGILIMRRLKDQSKAVSE